jgi:hypothetical protein
MFFSWIRIKLKIDWVVIVLLQSLKMCVMPSWFELTLTRFIGIIASSIRKDANRTYKCDVKYCCSSISKFE